MSLKHELEVWLAALEAFDAHEYDAALARFEEISYYSKVLFNTALIHATRGQHERAIADFARAITLDPFFAVAHFQLGVFAFLLGHMAEARRSFDRAFSLFHDNHTIDYRQLGLDFQLFSCEVRFNRGLSLIYSGQREAGMEDLLAAQADKQSDMHDVIDEAISDRAVGYTVFSIPVGIVFRPPAYKVENLDTRDYLGKAQVIAATEAADLSTGFPGARIGTAAPGISETSDVAQAVPTRSKTSAGRLERTERAGGPTVAAGNGGKAKLRRSQTSKPALVSTSTASTAPKADPSTRNPVPKIDAPLSQSKEATGADSGEAGSSASPSRPPPLVASSIPPALRSRGRSNTAPSKRLGLVHSRSFSARQPAVTSDAFFSPPAPSRPATRPPPLDLGSLRPPASPRHRRSASSPALLSAELVRLTTTVDEPSRFAQLQKEAVQDQHSTRETTGTALATGTGAVYPSSSNTHVEALQLQPAPTATPPPPSTASIKARDILVSALTLLRTESPPLMRTLRTPDVDPPALARSGSDPHKIGSVPQNQLPGGQAGSPPSQPIFGRSGNAAPSASVESLSNLKPTMRKIRVKLRWGNEVRAMSLQPDASLDVLHQHVATKLGLDAAFHLTFRDVDGTVVTLRDEEDWECAVDIAREGVTSPVGTGQLEIEVVVP